MASKIINLERDYQILISKLRSQRAKIAWRIIKAKRKINSLKK